MKILYYYWGETVFDTARTVLSELGLEISYVSLKRTKYDYDYEFMNELRKVLNNPDGKLRYDSVFSFNYFPDISRVAKELGIIYYSWVYDAPHLTLESLTLNNYCNKVYLFDYSMYLKYYREGITTVNYLPLPSRIIYNNDQIKSKEYKHSIAFVGNLYDGEQDQYGKIKFLPDYITGYLDAIINAQGKIYGADIIDDAIDKSIYDVIAQYVTTNLGKDYKNCSEDIFKNIVRRRITMNERIEALTRLGNDFGKDNIALYCGTPHYDLPITYMGYAEYNEQMPEIFKSSKINLNISLRSIQTGIPLRVMDIMGAGGFCITNYQAELGEYFENGKDIVWYESMDDLVEKCSYYLANDEERERIARQGQITVSRLFSYSNQFRKIFMDIQEK